jgi:hypothetical protein
MRYSQTTAATASAASAGSAYRAASSAGRTRPLSGGSIRGTHVFRLILLNQGIASLPHASARRLIRRSSVKIGVAKSDVSLPLLKESRVIG